MTVIKVRRTCIVTHEDYIWAVKRPIKSNTGTLVVLPVEIYRLAWGSPEQVAVRYDPVTNSLVITPAASVLTGEELDAVAALETPRKLLKQIGEV